MMKHLKTRAVDQSEYVVYWNKAEEFFEIETATERAVPEVKF